MELYGQSYGANVEKRRFKECFIYQKLRDENT
jgi:hypothetical protein